MMYKSSLTIIFSFLFHSLLSAQDNDGDFMRSMGKMYVVVAVIIVVFLGIVLFLLYLDRKLTNIENQITDHGPDR